MLTTWKKAWFPTSNSTGAKPVICPKYIIPYIKKYRYGYHTVQSNIGLSPSDKLQANLLHFQNTCFGVRVNWSPQNWLWPWQCLYSWLHLWCCLFPRWHRGRLTPQLSSSGQGWLSLSLSVHVSKILIHAMFKQQTGSF